MILTQTNIFDGNDLMVQLLLMLSPGWDQGSECIKGHIEVMQNRNKIKSLVLLLALEK